MLESIEDVIAALGGFQATADEAGVTVTAVYNWKKRNAIPSDKFLVISAALKKRSKKVSSSIFGFADQPEAAG